MEALIVFGALLVIGAWFAVVLWAAAGLWAALVDPPPAHRRGLSEPEPDFIIHVTVEWDDEAAGAPARE
ncbi:MAG: hypothetical protein OXU72_13880 [Gammaproteobacteria bacterium]|nr:hypothetical protein [Rhodospirillaceae bacterium]MDE0063861.1 hypothetical protein [Gammaproteobacteria bacterium]